MYLDKFRNILRTNHQITLQLVILLGKRVDILTDTDDSPIKGGYNIPYNRG